MGLQRPGAQVVGDVEGGVDVGEPHRGRPLHAHGVGQRARVARGQLRPAGARRRAARARSPAWRSSGAGARAAGARSWDAQPAGVLDPQAPAQPLRLLDQVLEQEGEAPRSRSCRRGGGTPTRSAGSTSGEVLGVAALVEEREVVVAAARPAGSPGAPRRGRGPARRTRAGTSAGRAPRRGARWAGRRGRCPSPASVSRKLASRRSSGNSASASGARKKRAGPSGAARRARSPSVRAQLGVHQRLVAVVGRAPGTRAVCRASASRSTPLSSSHIAR